MSELWCPICPSHEVTPWRMIGKTQWYICSNGHKFSNPTVIPDAIDSTTTVGEETSEVL